MNSNFDILIIGRGTAGIMTAAQMLKKFMLPYLYWNKMLKGQDV
jgi:aspartate oxidase